MLRWPSVRERDRSSNERSSRNDWTEKLRRTFFDWTILKGRKNDKSRQFSKIPKSTAVCVLHVVLNYSKIINRKLAVISFGSMKDVSVDKIACFRLDIDTLRCIKEGVPCLIDVADKYGAKLTFFLSPGRSFRLRDLFLKSDRSEDMDVSASYQEGEVYKVPAVKKLGCRYLFETLTLNPNLSSYCPQAVRLITDRGHQLGLHGGRNHGAWMREANTWNKAKLQAEIKWGMQRIEKITTASIVSAFCSPGWCSNERLAETLSELQFSILADEHGRDLQLGNITTKAEAIINFPTHLVGEPGGVGYFESLSARGFTDKEILEQFRCDIREVGNFAVFYDHPCFIGGMRKDLAGGVFSVVADEGYKVVTFDEAVTFESVRKGKGPTGE